MKISILTKKILLLFFITCLTYSIKLTNLQSTYTNLQNNPNQSNQSSQSLPQLSSPGQKINPLQQYNNYPSSNMSIPYNQMQMQQFQQLQMNPLMRQQSNFYNKLIV